MGGSATAQPVGEAGRHRATHQNSCVQPSKEPLLVMASWQITQMLSSSPCMAVRRCGGEVPACGRWRDTCQAQNPHVTPPCNCFDADGAPTHTCRSCRRQELSSIVVWRGGTGAGDPCPWKGGKGGGLLNCAGNCAAQAIPTRSAHPTTHTPAPPPTRPKTKPKHAST